jgi:rare lipoprotein A
VVRPLLFASLALLLAGCGATSARSPAGAPATPGAPAMAAAPGDGSVQSGLASYYADSLQGRPTASGEPYDPQALTAAHRTLPFGTLVEVSREDGRRVTVRINDRGPFAGKRRIVDLSRRAAETLGMIRAGVVQVSVRVLEMPPERAGDRRRRSTSRGRRSGSR